MSARSLLPVVVALSIECGPARPPVTSPPVITKPDPKPVDPNAALSPPQPTLRLPKNFVPTGYAARLAIDPAKSNFTGTMAITGKVSERTSVIWLHGWKLSVGKASAHHEGGDIALTVTPKGEDLLEVRAETPLDAGTWTLTLDYRADYERIATTGAFKQIVAEASYVETQFESIYARRAFPCVDEPDNKVPWKLTLDVPKALVALSRNASTVGLEYEPKFMPSLPMPAVDQDCLNPDTLGSVL